ncbi:MAG: hypothetical protein ABI410_01550 [Rhodoferax sp.]|uniref:hypothetical protein n=1 Tax=Rhodoferax sp. TaxID=50421 RepID=UPI003266AB24
MKSLRTSASISFVVCAAHRLVTPERMHKHAFLEQLLPGFLIGLIESFLYGAYRGLAYVPVYNFFSRRFHRDTTS